MPDLRKACLVIGVNSVIAASKLAPLQAAVSGANKFAAWAETQGFETVRITDASGPVTIQGVKGEVKKIVDSGVYSQFLVYFAGHGVLKTWGAETWLLSNAASDPNEAVNLSGSTETARASGIPHIVFISDACRSIISDTRLLQLSGSVLFPSGTSKETPEIDTFFASLAGFSSYEVPAVDPQENYKSVFTECLLTGLAGPDASVCETIGDGDARMWVVSSRTLKPYLRRTVPEAAIAVDIRLEQIPELRVESQPPKYLAKLLKMPPSFGSAGAPSALLPPQVSRAMATNRQIDSYFVPGASLSTEEEAIEDDEQFSADMALLIAKRAKEAFDARTGLTVFGARIEQIVVDRSDVRTDIVEQGDATHVRIHDDLVASSVLIRFADGSGTCVAGIPGFIGSIVVERGRVTSVSYAPSKTNPRFSDYQFLQFQVNKRRAFIAVAARRGFLDVNAENAESFSAYARDLNRLDPVFGIYAAYAYWHAGMKAELQAVYEWMSADRETPVPFDVALLAGRLKGADPDVNIAPSMPMMSQGWLLLNKDVRVPDWVRDAANYTLPSLWTTFSPEGVSLVSEHFRPSPKMLTA